MSWYGKNVFRLDFILISYQLTPIRKTIRDICGVDNDMTAVTDILIFGLQLYQGVLLIHVAKG